MKKFFAQFVLFAISIVSMAQTQNIYEWKNGTITIKNSSEIDSITFSIPDELIGVATDSIIETTATTMTAIYSANFSVNSSSNVIEKGICYSIANETPTVNDSTQMFGYLNNRTWISVLKGLKASTTYYFRPFLKTNDKIFYGTAKAFTTSDTGWKSLGKATFVDGILTSIFNAVVEEPYEVEIQENELVPGFYRLVNPYTSSYPKEEWEFDDAKDYCLEIHAEDPDAVWFGETELGVDLGYGMISAISIADYYVQGGNDPALVKEYGYYGTLKDGEITFPVKGILYTMPYHPNGAGWYYANSDGTFSILLPGYVKKDYSASVDYTGIFTTKDATVYASAQLTLGADVTDAQAIVMPLAADAAAVADAIAAGELEAMKVEAGRIEVPFNAEELGGNNFQIIVAVLADGAVKTVASASFEYYAGGKNPWKSLGTGYYTDDVILPLFYENGTPVTYEVEILEHTENPGLYRIMNPYAKAVHPAGDDDYAPEGMYIEVNATDAEGVYIQQQSLGMDWGYGEMSLVSYGATYLGSNPFETVKGAGYLGKVVDGVITFPTFTQSNGAKLQGILYMGTSGYMAGKNSKMEIVLPGSNAFARNMVKAQAKVTAQKLKKMDLSGLKVEKIRKVIFSRKVEASFKL